MAVKPTRWEGARPRAAKLAALSAAVMILMVVPVPLPQYLQSLATEALIYGIFALSLDLLLGYGGMLSLGHAAFLGVGGYTAALLMVREGIASAWLGLAAAAIVSALGALILGVVALRVSGVYFLLVTFALAQLVYSVAQTWSFLALNGTEGIAGLVFPTLNPINVISSTLGFYEFVVVLLLVTYLALWRLVRSPFGRALVAIRQNELRMQALGYNTWWYRYVAFVVAGMIAGVAGALLAYQSGIVVPDNIDILVSGTAVFMVLLGGAGTLYGPVIGAIVISVIEYYGSVYLPSTWPLVLGLVFVGVVLFTPNGIVGAASKTGAMLRRRWLRDV